MNSSLPRLLAAFLVGLVLTTGLLAQAPKLNLPAPSPACTLRQRVGLTDIEIVYSRPSMRGRQIFGGMLSYGEVWRTGANASTKISFSTPVKLNGVEIPAGHYALYTIPDPSVWTVIIYKDTSLFGAFNYAAKDDLVRFEAPAMTLTNPVETFTMEFGDLRDDSATLNLIWEKTQVPIRVEVGAVAAVLVQIDAAMASTGKKPYAGAAQFYLENDLDLAKALGWINSALAERPGYSAYLLKARILAKMGDKGGAIAAANQSLALAAKAEGPAREEYTRLAQQLLSSLR